MVLAHVFRAVASRIPARPWIANSALESRRWVKERPTVGVMLAQPGIRQAVSGLIDSWEISPTIYEASPTGHLFKIDYRSATLEVRPAQRGAPTVVLVPEETGGFLDEERHHAQAVIVKFRWPTVPCRFDCAPDLSRGITLVLRGVGGRLHSKRGINGFLPAVHGQIIDPTAVGIEPGLSASVGFG
jgi:hypothetical protein